MKYGRYDIVGELGKGSMGVIYRAHDPQIDRAVALKVLRQDRVTSEDFIQRFFKEAKAIGRLSHPNIVTVFDVGQDQGTLYIAMEFLEGSPLDRVIQEKRLSLEEIVDIGVQVAEALDYAHGQGIIHRDIKPANIILTASGQARITDFGIARIEDPSATQQTQAGEILGTPSYMSPEQVMSQRVDGRSDLYSLGVIVYELSTGVRPFRGENMAATFRAIIQDTPVEPIKRNPSIPPALSELVMKSLNKEPARRFETGKAMAEALKACLKEAKFKILPQEFIKEKLKQRGLFVVIALILISLVGGVSYYVITTRKSPIINTPHPETPATVETPSISEEPELPPPSPVKHPPIIQALLKVDSLPSGAQVFLDGSLKGETPLNLELPIGKYEVRLNLPDYHEWEAPLQLDEEGEIPLFVRLLPMEDRNP